MHFEWNMSVDTSQIDYDVDVRTFFSLFLHLTLHLPSNTETVDDAIKSFDLFRSGSASQKNPSPTLATKR